MLKEVIKKSPTHKSRGFSLKAFPPITPLGHIVERCGESNPLLNVRIAVIIGRYPAGGDLQPGIAAYGLDRFCGYFSIFF